MYEVREMTPPDWLQENPKKAKYPFKYTKPGQGFEIPVKDLPTRHKDNPARLKYVRQLCWKYGKTLKMQFAACIQGDATRITVYRIN